VDPATALADLTEISSHVEAVVVVDTEGVVLASTFADDAAARPLAAAAAQLVDAAADVALGGGRRLTQAEVALREGSLFLARDEERTIVARVAAGAPAGLVLYDLRTALRSIAADEPAQPKPAARKRTVDA
jgi:predicted regulator of Ras-like GTPase activity (Roadblock/LC7/MglB family)